jgi:hypothetical protein
LAHHPLDNLPGCLLVRGTVEVSIASNGKAQQFEGLDKEIKPGDWLPIRRLMFHIGEILRSKAVPATYGVGYFFGDEMNVGTWMPPDLRGDTDGS